MNYLAHAFLSGNDQNLLVGNFIADHIRGNNFEGYSEEIIRGIKLHRQIDSFSDNHELFKVSKRIFYDGFEKYSGILVDIYFDYFLAADFGNYADVTLENFATKVYGVYRSHRALLPFSSQRFLEYVLKNDVYTTYANIEGIEKVLYHLSGRVGHNVRLDHSVKLFVQNEPDLKNNFREFFGAAIKHFLDAGGIVK